MQVKASHKAIQRAFVDVVTAITRRLQITIKSDNATEALTASLSQLAIGSEAPPLAIDEGNRGGRGQGKGRRRRRGRGGRGRGLGFGH